MTNLTQLTAEEQAIEAKVAIIMARFGRRKLELFLHSGINHLDVIDGDPDLEADGDEADGNGSEDDEMLHSEYNGIGCPVADPDGPSAPEWHTLGRHKGRVLTHSLPHEDAEDDDEDHGGDEAEPNFARVIGEGAGCKISDSDFGADDVGEEIREEENEQMGNDVPVLPVFALEPNPFDGKRVFLGMSNLQPSFVSGCPMKAAD